MEEGLTREAAATWLDRLMESQRQRKAMTVLSGKVEANIDSDSLDIFRGIEVLADVLGAELQEEHCDDEFHGWYFYSFSYDGVKIMQASEERLESYGQA